MVAGQHGETGTRAVWLVEVEHKNALAHALILPRPMVVKLVGPREMIQKCNNYVLCPGKRLQD